MATETPANDASLDRQVSFPRNVHEEYGATAEKTNDGPEIEMGAHVVWADRTAGWSSCCDLSCGLLFFALLLAQVTMLLWTMTDTDIKMLSPGDAAIPITCVEQQITPQATQFVSITSDSLLTDICLCEVAEQAKPGRRLQDGSKLNAMQRFNEQTLFEFLETKPFVPTLCFLLTFVFGFLWLLIMQWCARTLTWLSLILIVTTCIVGGNYLATVFGAAFGWAFVVIGGVVVLWALCRFRQINQAAEFMAEAAVAWRVNWRLFPATLPVQVVYVLFLYAMYEMWLAVYETGSLIKDLPASSPWKNIPQVELSPCTVVPDVRNYKMALFVQVMLTWLAVFIRHVKTNTVAMSIADFCFPENPDSPALEDRPFRALRISLTSSFPTLSATSSCVAMTEELRTRTAHKSKSMNPLLCCCTAAAHMVVSCIASTIAACSRFAVIFHAISGFGFWKSGVQGHALLKEQLESVLITDTACHVVIEAFSFLLSAAVGFVGWAMFDASIPSELNLRSLDVSTWSDGNQDSAAGANHIFIGGSMVQLKIHLQVVFWTSLVLMLVLNHYPLLSLFLVVLFGNYITGIFVGPVCGIFFANVAHIILSFFSDQMLDAVDTVHVCFAILKHNGHDVVMTQTRASFHDKDEPEDYEYEYAPTDKLFHMVHQHHEQTVELMTTKGKGDGDDGSSPSHDKNKDDDNTEAAPSDALLPK